MVDNLIVTIVTPEKEVYNGKAAMVVLPAFKGKMGVLPRHMPMMVALRSGEVKIKTDVEVKSYLIDGGLAEVTGETVKVIANTAENNRQ